MAIGTRGGNLLLKNTLLQTGCECCGDGICSCAQRMPSAVVFAFEDFAYSWFASSSGGPDMSVYASELADFQESYALTIPRTGFTAGSHATYSLQTTCYNLNACTPQSSCTNSELQFLRIIQVSLRINCNETFSELQWNLVSSRACWGQFSNNREGYVLRAAGGQEASSASSLFGLLPMSGSYPFCPGDAWDLSVDAPNNSTVLGQTNFYAQWIGGVFDSNWGNYVATSGRLTITPVFDNPLP